MTSPGHGPDLGSIIRAVHNGDIRAALDSASIGPRLRIPADAIRAGYETVKSRIRNGVSEQDIASFLLLGLSPTESVELLAKDGFVKATLKIVADHQFAHPENGVISVPRDVIEVGFEKVQPRVRDGYSEQDAASFLSLGLSPIDSAELMAKNGFINATLQIVKDHALQGISPDAIAAGFKIARDRIRNGYSELDAAKFVTLSTDAALFFPALAENGFLKSAYLLKMALGLEDKLPDSIIDRGLRCLEAKPFTSMDGLATSLMEARDLLLRGEFPTDLTPQLMLEEIAQNPTNFSVRLQGLIARDRRVLTESLTGGWE